MKIIVNLVNLSAAQTVVKQKYIQKNMESAALWVIKVGTGCCNFSADSCTFPTAEISPWELTVFNFAPKFPKMVFTSNFVFLETNLRKRKH